MVKLLQRAREGNVKYNTAKFQYKVSEAKYMGNIASESGLKPDAEKVCAIIEMPSPQSKEELQRFLGMVNYYFPVYSQTVGNYCTIATKLKERSSMDLHEHTPSVGRLKGILSNQPVLKLFDPTKPVKLQVDASKSGLGACILQEACLRIKVPYIS